MLCVIQIRDEPQKMYSFFFLTVDLLIPVYILRYMSTLDKTILNVKVSKTLKKEAQELADEIGLPLSTIVIVNLKEFVRSRSLTISALPHLKPEVEKEFSQAIADYRAGKSVSPRLSSAQAVADHLKTL